MRLKWLNIAYFWGAITLFAKSDVVIAKIVSHSVKKFDWSTHLKKLKQTGSFLDENDLKDMAKTRISFVSRFPLW